MKNKYTIGAICIVLLLFLIYSSFSFLSNLFFSYENKPQGELLKTILYVLGGIVALIGLWLTSRRTKSQEDQIREFIKQNSIAENGNVNDRFKNAIEHLGSDNDVISLGGIHSLHRIAKEHPDYRPTVFDILCSYIREKTKNIEVKEQYTDEEIKSHAIKPTICIQTTIDLLFKRGEADDYIYAGLKANLQGAKCIGANFDHAILIGADMKFGCFSLSMFNSCDLSCADLYKVYMYGTVLCGTVSRGASFRKAKLLESEFYSCNMQGADLTDAYFSAKDSSADIDFKGACLRNTKINNIDGDFCGAEIFESSIPWPRIEHKAFVGSQITKCIFTEEIENMDNQCHPGKLPQEMAEKLINTFSHFVQNDGVVSEFKDRILTAPNTDTIIQKPNI